jgi:mannose/fructose-specific phosphotransferase system component IIA
MKTDLLTLIISHGNIAEALYQGVENILGAQENVYTFSNQEDSLPVLADKIQNVIDENAGKHIIFFSDLKGGSCWTLANMIQKRNKNMTILSGVNLPMLVTYFNNKSSMGIADLIDKTVNDGCRGILKQNAEQ